MELICPECGSYDCRFNGFCYECADCGCKWGWEHLDDFTIDDEEDDDR